MKIKKSKPQPKIGTIRRCYGFVFWKTIQLESRVCMTTGWLEQFIDGYTSGSGSYVNPHWVAIAWEEIEERSARDKYEQSRKDASTMRLFMSSSLSDTKWIQQSDPVGDMVKHMKIVRETARTVCIERQVEIDANLLTSSLPFLLGESYRAQLITDRVAHSLGLDKILKFETVHGHAHTRLIFTGEVWFSPAPEQK